LEHRVVFTSGVGSDSSGALAPDAARGGNLDTKTASEVV